jgi:hypothetical protein
MRLCNADMVQFEETTYSYTTTHGLPRFALSLVSRTVLDKESVLVPLVPGLITTFGLYEQSTKEQYRD